MKRAALAISTASIAVLALLSGTAAQALGSGGYAVSRIALTYTGGGIAEDPATGLVYTGGYGTVGGQGAVTVIDGATRAVEASIAVPRLPNSIAVNPATDTVYASSYSGLTVIDGRTATVITTIALDGGQVAVDPATNTVYAATRLASNVTGIDIIDGATNSITATVALPSAASWPSLAVDAATDTVYAGGTGDGTLYAIDGASNTVTKSAQLNPYGHITGLAVDSATGNVYAVDDASNTVYVVNAATLAATASITGCPHDVVAAAADPTANVIFVTSYGSSSTGPADSTCVIDAATNTVAESFPRGGMAVAADPTTGAAFIAAWNPGNSIWVATPSPTDKLSPMIYGFGPSGLWGASATFAVGIPSSFPLMVSASPTPKITEAGPLPAGVTMSPTGVFSGTPSAGTVGTYPITVSASNGVSPDTTVSLDIVVDIAPTITSPATATFQTGVAGTFTVRASGTPAPTVSATGYPSWMTYTPGSSSGVLTGTPPPGSGGTSLVYIGAQNGSGFTASQLLTLTVNQPPALTVPSPLTFRVGRWRKYSISSTGFPTPVVSEQGTLPRGLSFQPGPGGTAAISGKPASGDAGKSYVITIIASNHIGAAATKKVTIRIQ